MEINLNVKYYYVINADQKMSKGKILAQVSHVAMQLGASYDVIGRAVVLKAPESELRRIIDISSVKMPMIYYIEDAGLTEVPKGSLTCIGFLGTPYVEKFTKKLKLV